MASVNEPAEDREERIEQMTKPHDLDEWYYNTRTGEVEQGKKSGSLHRMGPYPTREAATEAYERAADRNEAWDAADKAWEDDQ
ncbi:hypothetical protein [Georgenia sp. H159]|uniref:hypothetical protein n=1 Tax=Georgenia sp. H159 TaxID=3076115 RepID=UPI002D78484D|nr:hypothetical protein [Georgenia sp. H159]